MPQPAAYAPNYDYSDWSTNYPTTPHSGARLDTEFSEIASVTEAIIARLELIQRDDGEVANLSIGLDQLKPEIVLGVPTDWVTATDYEAKNVVWESDVLYVCNTAHTSGVFATDLGAGKWTAYLDYADPLGDAAAFATAASASATTATAQAVLATTAKTAAEAAQAAAEAAQAAAEAAFAAITFPIGIGDGGSGATTSAQARTNWGIGTGDSPTFAGLNITGGIDLGNPDTTITRASAGKAAVEGSVIQVASDLGVTIQQYDVDTTKNDVANTFTAAQVVSLAAAGVAFTLQSTDAGAGVGPVVVLDRNSASPAVSDVLGAVYYRGRSSTAASREYAQIFAITTDVTNATEDAYLSFYTLLNGAATEGLRIMGAQTLLAAGSAALPAVAFAGDPNTGLWNRAADQIGLAAGGADVAFAYAGGFAIATGQMLAQDGTATAPGCGFLNDTNTGMYRIGADNLGLAVNGTAYIDLNASRALFWNDVQLGAFGTPAAGSVGSRRLLDASITTGTPVAADSGKRIICTGGVTIPASVFAKGDTLIIDAGASSRTITQGASLTMTWEAVGTTGNRTLAANGRAIVTFESATTATISGSLTA